MDHVFGSDLSAGKEFPSSEEMDAIDDIPVDIIPESVQDLYEKDRIDVERMELAGSDC